MFAVGEGYCRGTNVSEDSFGRAVFSRTRRLGVVFVMFVVLQSQQWARNIPIDVLSPVQGGIDWRWALKRGFRCAEVQIPLSRKVWA